MPDAIVVTLTPYERDLLWREARYELDFQTRMDDDRETVVAGLARVQDFVRLFDDLGWEERDERTSYELTLPREQLRRVLGWLSETAEELLHDETAGPFAGGRPQHVDGDLELLHTARQIQAAL